MTKKSLSIFMVMTAAALLLLAAGCAPKASDLMPKINTGMNPAEVKGVMGEPKQTHCVHFDGHDGNYLVWEYSLIPDMPVCPSEGVGRVATGIVTLGLSEVAWSHAKAKPYWFYFHDNTLMHASKAFDCSKEDFCRQISTGSAKGCN